MSESVRKYAFSWDLLGYGDARQNIGAVTKVEVYRLMQYTMRDIIEKRYGSDAADDVFRESGRLAGEHFYDNYLAQETSFSALAAKFQDVLKDLGVGIMRVESSDLVTMPLTLSISEDLSCSGLPDLEYEYCAYEEGFIAGVLSKFTNKDILVREIDCWCAGDRTCRFVAKVNDQEAAN